MQRISLQFFGGPNPLFVSHKSDCVGYTEEHCFGATPEAGFPQNVGTKS